MQVKMEITEDAGRGYPLDTFVNWQCDIFRDQEWQKYPSPKQSHLRNSFRKTSPMLARYDDDRDEFE